MKDSRRNVDDDIDADDIVSRMIGEPNTTDITFEGVQTKGIDRYWIADKYYY